MKKLLLSLSVFIALQQYSYSMISNIFSTEANIPLVVGTGMLTSLPDLIKNIKDENTSKQEKVVSGTVMMLTIYAVAFIIKETFFEIIKAARTN